MKKRIWSLGIVIGLLCCVTTQAQTPVGTSDAIDIPGITGFPSPTAASMVKTEQIPVDYYNGTASTSIPLHVFKYYKHVLPISLSYQSTGLRVQERASWVGLGWALNAGGVVTRSVKGIPDDHSSGNGFFERGDFFNSFIPDLDDSTDKDLFNQIAEGDYDSDPDVFTVRAPTLSGEFAFIDDTLRFRSKQNALIEYTKSGSYKIASFIITDESGIKYTFAQQENTKTVSHSGGSPLPIQNYVSAWYLTKIEHPQITQDVLIEYDTIGYPSTQTTVSVGRRVYAAGNNPYCGTLSDAYFETTATTTNTAIYLKKIKGETPSGQYEVNFTLEARDDLTSEKRLKSIQVVENGQTQKEIEFGYGYFTTGAHKRLKLTSVQTFDNTGTNSLPEHKFEYYEGTIPTYDSKDVDYWGYYNAAGNVNTVPTAYTGGSTGALIYTSTNSRAPINSQVSLLKKITYPTGGTSSFVYERNDYGFTRTTAESSTQPAGGMRIKSITNYDGVSTANNIVKNISYGMDDGSGLSSGRIEGDPLVVEYGVLTNYAGNPAQTCAYYDIKPSSFYSIGHYSSNHLGYKKVTESISSASKFGETVYEFEKSPYRNRGSLTDTRIYKKDGTLKESIHTEKDNVFDGIAFNIGFEVKRSITSIDIGSGFSIEDTTFTYNTYSVYESWERVTTETTKNYNGETGFVQTGKTYTYGTSPSPGTHNKLLKKVTETVEGADTRVTNYNYIHETNSTMRNLNMTIQMGNILIEDGSGNDLNRTWLKWSNGFGVPSGTWYPYEQWTWQGTGTTAPASPNSSNSIRVTKVVEFDSYGNAIKVRDVNDTNTKAYYGSNASPFSQAGMSSVYGMYLTGIQKVLGTDNCSNCGTRPSGTDDLFTEAEYDSYGRVISVTDENEHSSTFEYDTFNRLIKGINPNGGVTKNNYFYSREPSGSYSSSAPNLVETVTGTDSYETNFSSSASSEWTKGGDVSFGTSYAGETTVRMGHNGGGGSSYIYRSPGAQHIWAKVDFYPDHTTESPNNVHAQPLAFQDPATGAPNRMTIRYNADTDEFFVFHRQNTSDWYTDYPFTIDAVHNQWYTLEMEKKGTVCMVWVYKKGESRSSGEYYEVDGYPADWTPKVQAWSKDDSYYLANLEYVINPQTSISYLDGLGREIQAQARGANSVITTETLYDKRGLPEIASRPIEIKPDDSPGYYTSGLMGGSSFTPGDTLPSASLVHGYYKPLLGILNDEDYAYSLTQYENSPLARVEESTLPGIEYKNGSGKEVTTTYSLNTGSTETFNTPAVTGLVGAKSWPANSLTKTISKDPSGNKTITYVNGWGQTIASGVDMDASGSGVDNLSRSSNDLVTEFAYDERGNLVLVEDPRGLLTKYWYNTLGQLIKKELPDQDEPNSYCYDDKGRLRYHRDPNHEANVSYYYSTPQYDYNYIKYDELDRPVETGVKEGLGSYVSACASYANNQTYPSSYHTPEVYYYYDGTNAYTGANNLNGRLTKVKYLESTGSWGETWYSYNNLGSVEWIVQKVPGVTGDIKITYTYDELGRQTQMGYNVTNSSDDHYFWYEYDALGRLEYVYSDTDSNPTGRIKEAEYSNYSADGQVAQMKLGNGNIQTVDYTYTAQGWLDKMNGGTVSSATNGDRFAMELSYADNGNIETQKWMQRSYSISSSVQYDYTYDKANRLTAADYTDNGLGSGDSNNGYDINPITYDKNGNITSIIRKGQGYYSYPFNSITITSISGTSNRLNSYGLQNGSSPAATKTVTYDANGNMLQNRYTNGVYNGKNLMTSVKSGTTTIQFGYDADGNRVRKEVVGGTESTYVRGADGQTIAVYENGTRAFVNLLAGGQILGNYDGSQRRYFLKDHLGTVRTTVDQSGNVDGWDDYYPFGLVMSGRSNNTSNPDDLYKFTGHERDDEASLNLDYMTARNYDPITGRFMQVDPHSSNYPGMSPYVYASNNPIFFIDPTGTDIVIHYFYDGEDRQFVFDGTNGDGAPDNTFVQAFITAYKYATSNGEGKSLLEAATNKDLKVNLAFGGDSYSKADWVFWNPNQGFTDGGDSPVISPAISLEHEMDHTIEFLTNPEGLAKNLEDNSSMPFAMNMEEKRAINGSEQSTARSVGEIGPNQRTRKDHFSSHPVMTTGPTSTTINKRATYRYWKSRFNARKKAGESTRWEELNMKKYQN